MNTPKPAFEKKDIHVRELVILIGALLILIVGTVLVTLVLDRMIHHSVSGDDTSRLPLPRVNALPPEPRLQVNPEVDLIRLRDVENDILNNFAWIDPAAGKVRIPIARAMALLAERGLPSRSVRNETSE